MSADVGLSSTLQVMIEPLEYGMAGALDVMIPSVFGMIVFHCVCLRVRALSGNNHNHITTTTQSQP